MHYAVGRVWFRFIQLAPTVVWERAGAIAGLMRATGRTPRAVSFSTIAPEGERLATPALRLGRTELFDLLPTLRALVDCPVSRPTSPFHRLGFAGLELYLIAHVVVKIRLLLSRTGNRSDQSSIHARTPLLFLS